MVEIAGRRGVKVVHWGANQLLTQPHEPSTDGSQGLEVGG
jgi:hypothetical protein